MSEHSEGAADRGAFEAAIAAKFPKMAATNFFRRTPVAGDYINAMTQFAWEGWQAALQSAAASTRVEPASWMPCEFVTIDGNSRCKTCGQVRHSGCDAGGRQAKAPAPQEPPTDEQIEGLLPDPDLENHPVELWGQNANDDFWNRTSIRKVVRAALSTQGAAESSLREKLRDPVMVHAAMLRGEIAKPDIRDMLHAYSAEALARWDAAKQGANPPSTPPCPAEPSGG